MGAALYLQRRTCIVRAGPSIVRLFVTLQVNLPHNNPFGCKLLNCYPSITNSGMLTK